MTTDNKPSVRSTIADLLKADNPDGDRLRQFSTDLLLRLVSERSVHLDCGDLLPIPEHLLKGMRDKPDPLIVQPPNWPCSGPYIVTIANSTRGDSKGPAGFAALIESAGGKEVEASCWHVGASNQEAETRAIVLALQQVPKGASATIHCGNSIIVNTFSDWMPQWAIAGWRNRRGQAPANLNLWQTVHSLASERSVTMVHSPPNVATSASHRAAHLALQARERGFASAAGAR